METDPENPARRELFALALTGAVNLSAAAFGGPTLAAASRSQQRTPVTRTNDVVIVGGGSAGAVLAARLSERAGRQVLLIEAGQSYGPGNYPKAIASGDSVGAATGVDWGYLSEPGFVGHPIAAFRGKVLGGSSAMNGGVAIRARPQDFQNWNLPGWSYEDLLPSFKKLEDGGAADTLRGQGGPFRTRQLTAADVSPMQRAFMDATVANGYRRVDDFDGAESHGTAPYRMNIIDGIRLNTGMAYLTEAVRRRPNLKIQSNALVDAVLFEGTRAVGVRLATGAVIRAGEVILSGGVYGSPAILLRSGIGPSRDLRQLEIPIVVDLSVGQRLKDHPFYYNAYAARPDRIGAQTPVIGAKLWTRSSSTENGDLDLDITATHLFPADQSPTKVGFVLAVGLTRPHSVGRLWLASRDPNAAPKIDFNFLADAVDRARLMEGVRLARRIGSTAPLSGLVHSELAPGPKAESDAEIQQSINATLDTYHHPVSTVPMGIDGDSRAVVDLQGRVRGVSGLRVIDASIMPDAISVATGVTTMAMAEHLAAQIA